MYSDLTNKTFGALKVLKRADPPENWRYKNRSFWICACSLCGREKIMAAFLLKKVKSCGCVRKSSRKEIGKAGFTRILGVYKRNAKKRNYEFLLSEQEFKIITSSNCYYCDSPPLQKSNSAGTRGYTDSGIEHGQYLYNGIDRIDNSKGYILENCVPCCHQCNAAKSNMPISSFIKWIHKVNEILSIKFKVLGINADKH
jgi:hypothetical protein